MKNDLMMFGKSKALVTVLAFALVMLFVSAGSVQAAGNSPPSISSIDVQPDNPTRYNDLTCTVTAADTDGNLDYVDFRWYVNGALVRESTRTLYGSSGTVSDTFTSSKNAGDYVVCDAKAYDFDGAYDHETHAVYVGSTLSNSRPTVSYVDITPRHPNPQQDLTCSILAIDADDNLDYVSFEWYKNDRLVRTAMKDIQGSSDTANDVLSAGSVYSGEWVKCRVKVYDAAGQSETKESAAVLFSGTTSISYPYYSYPYYTTYQYNSPYNTYYNYYQPYQPYSPYYPYGQGPVAVISADKTYADEDETIRFSGTGSYAPYGKEIIQYMFDYGDGETSAWIPDDTPYAYHSYEDYGDYYARLKVKDSDNRESAWSNPVTIHVNEGNGEGEEGERPVIDDISIIKQPSGNYVTFTCKVEAFDHEGQLDYAKFKWYLDNDVISTEKDTLDGGNDDASSAINLAVSVDSSVKCEVTVYDKDHNFVVESATANGYAGSGIGCEVGVNRFDYYTYLTEGKNAWVEMEAKNSGSSPGTMTFRLYIDGSYKDQYSTYVLPDKNAVKRFEFPLSLGTHKVKVEASLSCGGSTNRTAEITVFPAQTTATTPLGNQPNVVAEGETNVVITPASLDVKMDSGDVVSIQITSPSSAKFNISVENLPENWTNYQKSVEVKGSDTVYVYVVPKALGNYNFKVRVTTGTKTFEQNVALYVAPGGNEARTNGISGLISIMESNWFIGLAIVIILIVLTALYLFAGRMKKKGYEDYVYGERKTPYYGPYYPASGYAVQQRPPQPPQPPQKTTNAHQQVHWHSGGGHWHTRGGRWFFGRYSDGTGYPKHGVDFVRK